MKTIDTPSFACEDCDLHLFCVNTHDISIKRRHRLLKRKETLHHAGDPFTHLYAIQYGALKTHTITAMGDELIHGFYLKNEVYGYEAIQTGRHFFSSTALTETMVCDISYQDFTTLLHLEPVLLNRMLHLMSGQLTARSYLNLITAQQSLSAFILDLATRLSPHNSQATFLLPMSYQDIGHYLRLATETISRLLSRLKDKKILLIQNKQLSILEPNLLKDIAQGMMSL